MRGRGQVLLLRRCSGVPDREIRPISEGTAGAGCRLLDRVLYFPCGLQRTPLIPEGIRESGIWHRM